MAFIFGFIHGERYLITSAFDGAVFDVKKARTKNGTRVLTWNTSGEPHQNFIANAESGGFRLAAGHTDDLMVLDQENNSSRVIIWPFQGGDNQMWNSVPVGHNPDLFFIQNVRSGLFIRNMGLGTQLECTPMNEFDPSLHWRLIRVDQ